MAEGDSNAVKALKHSVTAEALLRRADVGAEELDHDGERLATLGKAQVHATLAVYYFGLCERARQVASP